MADSEGCERNPFARGVFRPKVAHLQNLSEIEKMVCPSRFGPLRHALLSDATDTSRSSTSVEPFRIEPEFAVCGVKSREAVFCNF